MLNKYHHPVIVIVIVIVAGAGAGAGAAVEDNGDNVVLVVVLQKRNTLQLARVTGIGKTVWAILERLRLIRNSPLSN